MDHERRGELGGHRHGRRRGRRLLLLALVTLTVGCIQDRATGPWTNIRGIGPGGGGGAGGGGGGAGSTISGTWRATRQLGDLVIVTTLSFAGGACTRTVETVDLVAGRSTIVTTAGTFTQSGSSITIVFASGEPPLGTFTGQVSGGGDQLAMGDLTFRRVG